MGNGADRAEIPVVLSIAGFDPSSGAGITADLKTMAALGAYGIACITAMTVQSTLGVRRVETVNSTLITETLAYLREDTPPAAIKVGMLHTEAAAGAVADFLETVIKTGVPVPGAGLPVVVDPVLRSSSGAPLLNVAGLAVLRERILPLATWTTPNVEEAAILAGAAVQAEQAAAALRQRYPNLGVVVTGGHLDPPDDYLLAPGGAGGVWLRGERVATRSTHGTGCAFSTALAVRLAFGDDAEAAVRAAKVYVAGALRHAPGIGRGKGPLGHFWGEKG